MKLLAYQINGQTIGIDIGVWDDAMLSGNTAFMAIADSGSTPTDYVDISSIVYWDGFGAFTTLTENEVKDEILKLKPDNLTDEEEEIYESYQLLKPSSLITNGVCELIDDAGGQEMTNITPVPLLWDNQYMIDFNTFSHVVGNSKIIANKSGYYAVTFNVNGANKTNGRATTGVQIRWNGVELIPKTLSASYTRNASNNDNHNTIPSCTIYLSTGDYIEVVVFRLGDNNSVLTKEKASFVQVKYLGK